MNNKQLIICVEANNQTKSDFIYINDAIKEFYRLDTHTKISPVFMDGRGNYDTPKTEREIIKRIKEYAVSNSRNESYVLYCFDCDKYDTNSEDKDFLEKARHYCSKEGNRRFVWFCRDVEDVFLGKQTDKKQKRKEANRFKAKNLIKAIDISNLSGSQFKSHFSNLCTVLDEFLVRKK